MATVGELITRVQYPYSNGVESDDSRLTRRYVYSILKSGRNTLMFNKVNKNQFISHWNFQTLPCVEMIVVPPHDCPCLPPVGCEMMRTKYKLPSPIANLSKHIIASVTSVDGVVTFNETTFGNKKYKKGNKYTSDKPDYFIKDEYLYITVRSRIKAITVIALFNDPYEVAKFPNICNEGCIDCSTCPPNPMDIEFNIDEDLERTLIEFAIQEIAVFLGKLEKNDKLNNSSDD